MSNDVHDAVLRVLGDLEPEAISDPSLVLGPPVRVVGPRPGPRPTDPDFLDHPLHDNVRVLVTRDGMGPAVACVTVVGEDTPRGISFARSEVTRLYADALAFVEAEAPGCLPEFVDMPSHRAAALRIDGPQPRFVPCLEHAILKDPAFVLRFEDGYLARLAARE